MSRSSRQRLSRGVALVLCACALQAQSTPSPTAPTRAALLQEATRLAHEAEEIEALAEEHADDKAFFTAQKRAALLFASAIALWRKAGDFDRVMAGAEELTRLYSVLGDDRAVVDRLHAEEQFWIAEGDRRRQAQTVLLLSIRQGQAHHEQEAIRAAARALEIARSAGVTEIQAQALDQLGHLHRSSGDRDAAAAYERASTELWNRISAVRPAPVRAAVTTPDQWLELPEAPLNTDHRMVEGVMQPVLVNRSTRDITSVELGCVFERDGKVDVVTTGARWVRHVAPAKEIPVFESLDEPATRWTDEKPRCEAPARIAVTQVTFADRTQWRAGGTRWP